MNDVEIVGIETDGVNNGYDNEAERGEGFLFKGFEGEVEIDGQEGEEEGVGAGFLTVFDIEGGEGDESKGQVEGGIFRSDEFDDFEEED